MSWLITGGCGFIGSNLADELLRRGEEVILFDNLSRPGSAQNLDWLRSNHGSDIRFISGDIRVADDISKLVKDSRPLVIAHLAGQVAATTSIENPRLDFEVNALGALNVLEAVRIHDPAVITLFSSTNKVYGSLDHLSYKETATRFLAVDYDVGFDESLALDGSTPYGCSKLTADAYFRDFYRMFGIRTIVFRHSSMYGGRQFATVDQGWVGWFCLKALEAAKNPSLTIPIAGTGKQVRDLLFSSDLVSCYLSASAAADQCAGHAFNIGGGMENSLSLIELFGILSSNVGCDLKFSAGEWRVADQKVFVASTMKAKAFFGWEPAVTCSDGLAQMMCWSRTMLDLKRSAKAD
jgi:CDP-paratose 2-epimerase